MNEIEFQDLEVMRELTTPEQLVKLVAGAVVGFLAKKLIEDAVEAGFRRRNP